MRNIKKENRKQHKKAREEWKSNKKRENVHLGPQVQVNPFHPEKQQNDVIYGTAY